MVLAASEKNPEAVRQLRDLLRPLRIDGQIVALHSSFKSLHRFEGSPWDVVEAFSAEVNTLVAPGFYYGGLCRPVDASPSLSKNGLKEGDFGEAECSIPFVGGKAQIDASMGVIAAALAADPSALRNSHPVVSWSARGCGASQLVGWDDFQDPYRTLRGVVAKSGKVVLFGTNLTSCTLLHLAEERIGRRPFVRWAKSANGSVPVRVGGCSEGFQNLWPRLSSAFSTFSILGAKVHVAKAEDLLHRAEQVLSLDPRATVCRPDCERCRDAILGGPD